ncbi:MAG: LysE family translocator [Pseudomonadota bacterium]
MTDIVIALCIFLFPLAYSPGPGNMFFAANSARFGFRSTIPANVGYHLATWAVTAAIGFGFLATLEQFPQVFLVLKVGGGLYVFWLAWKLLRAGVLKGGREPTPATFADGVILLVLNPKAYVIIALMFTQFLDPARGTQLAMVLLITSIFTLNNLMAFTLWALVGDRMSRLFRTPESARILNGAFGLLLAGIALWMLFS